MINRIVVIGNGFDLAHGLKTSYQNFLCWYLKGRFEVLDEEKSEQKDEVLCEFSFCNGFDGCDQIIDIKDESIVLKSYKNDEYVVCEKTEHSEKYVKITPKPLLKQILSSVESKGWSDIEADFYQLLKDLAPKKDSKSIHSLNEQLDAMKGALHEYLSLHIDKPEFKPTLRSQIMEPFDIDDFSTKGRQDYKEHLFSIFFEKIRHKAIS